jgi:hypothetical protein
MIPGSDVMYKTGNDLFRDCTQGESVFDKTAGRPKEVLAHASCVSYIAGVVDVQGMRNMLGISHTFCVPKEVPMSQLASIVLKYLKNNPEDRHGVAAAFVNGALLEAFPCK